MSIDAALSDAVRSAVAPLADDVRGLQAEVNEILRAQSLRLASVDEAAENARVSPCAIRRSERDGIVKSVRHGGPVLIDLSSLRTRTDKQTAVMARQLGGTPLLDCEDRRQGA